MSLDAKRYCAHCHEYDRHPLPDCPEYVEPEEAPTRCVVRPSALAITDAYADDQQPALWGSAFALESNGNPKPVGQVPTVTITEKR